MAAALAQAAPPPKMKPLRDLRPIDVVGVWVSKENRVVELEADGRYRYCHEQILFQGHWRIEGRRVLVEEWRCCWDENGFLHVSESSLRWEMALSRESDGP